MIKHHSICIHVTERQKWSLPENGQKNVTCPQSELLLSNNKAWDIDTWYYMDEPRKHPILSKEHQNPACLHVPLNHLSYVHWVKKIRNIKYTGKEKQKSKNTFTGTLFLLIEFNKAFWEVLGIRYLCAEIQNELKIPPTN